ncbi:HD-GYP domain-containing protein [Desulfothermobacter acidiphilus]|uniref:HD-GYP domain-containing protein n=1 Tax=Desulfothermobacter acidiphilus TaxID=1938353 RepID=UPI003F8B221F
MPVDLLRPGIRVGRPLYSSSGQLLVNAGTRLTEKVIKRLRLLGVSAIYVDDGFLNDVEIKDVISEQLRLQALVQVREFFQNPPQGAGRAVIQVKAMVDLVKDLVDELLGSQQVLVSLVDVRALDDYTFGHSVNVCLLSLLTGISLGYSRQQLISLGLGALLHDVGKTSIPAEILQKPGQLTPEEFALVKSHTVAGYRMLKAAGIDSLACVVALQHHERYLGQGYPQGLRGSEIHEFAAICGVADVFDALTADRCYRRAYPVYEAYEFIAGAGNYLFDYWMVQAFLENVAAYPVGTVVRLTSGAVGIVTGTKRGFPLRPSVRLFFDDEGNPSDPRELDLSQSPTHAVAEVVPEAAWQDMLRRAGVSIAKLE